MDKWVLRESNFMNRVKIAANDWAQSNARSLLSLEDRLKLIASGDDRMPVNIYIQAESIMNSIDNNSMLTYQAVACEAYNRIQEKYDVRPDGAPSHTKMPLLPRYSAFMKVKELVGGWLVDYRALEQFRYLIRVLPLDSINQIDVFVPYGTIVPEESRRQFGDLRIRAQRVYAEILRGKGCDTVLPVVSFTAPATKPYTEPLGGGSATVH